MKAEKGKTINYIKEKRTVSEEVKTKVKKYNRSKKQIVKSLENGPKTIPQITEETGLPSDEVTFYVMTMRKYGIIKAGELDDMDEYFFYQLTK